MLIKMNSTLEENNCFMSQEDYEEYLKISAYVFFSLTAVCIGCLIKLCCCRN